MTRAVVDREMRRAPELAAVLSRIREVVAPRRSGMVGACRIADLLERDLLPRAEGGDELFVCGIVGPNNSGKSALFNALLGVDASPSAPAGGATRRIVGAMAPVTLEALGDGRECRRFRFRPVRRAVLARDALRSASDGEDLPVLACPQLPASLMLVDTPDFDSIIEANRAASEVLLAVADLVIVVVTRHSYQNRAVVEFLRRWLDHGRPWFLVYNEAEDAAIAGAHTVRLVQQVGQQPLGVFWAPHSLAVQEGSEPLRARRLARPGEAEVGDDLHAALCDAAQFSALAERAFAAAIGRLEDESRQLSRRLRRSAAAARALLATAEERAADSGRTIASAAMPGGPFVEAFRTVLDRRTNFLSRNWRRVLRGARLGLEAAVKSVRGGWSADANEPELISLAEIEAAALRAHWTAYWEGLSRDIGGEARHPARSPCEPGLARLLDDDLTGPRREEARERAVRRLGQDSADLGEFRSVCEGLIEHAIDERGFDMDIQALADVATVAPLAVAAAIVIKTGGIGIDLAVAGSGAVSSFLVEKYAHLLGSGIVAAARRRWAVLRGGRIAAVLLETCLPRSGAALRSCADADEEMAGALDALLKQVRDLP